MAAFAPPELLWLVEGLLAALVLGLALSLAVSALLLAAPARLLELNRRASRWIDTRRHLEVLERPLMLERLFYRHHRVLGAGIALGAAYVLWRWAGAYDRDAVVALLDRRWRAAGLDWIVGAAEALVVGLHVLILGVGLVIAVRPSLLKNVERAANRWHPTFQAGRLDTVIDAVDRGVEIYPRLAGFTLLAASLWSLATLVPELLQLVGR